MVCAAELPSETFHLADPLGERCHVPAVAVHLIQGLFNNLPQAQELCRPFVHGGCSGGGRPQALQHGGETLLPLRGEARNQIALLFLLLLKLALQRSQRGEHLVSLGPVARRWRAGLGSGPRPQNCNGVLQGPVHGLARSSSGCRTLRLPPGRQHRSHLAPAAGALVLLRGGARGSAICGGHPEDHRLPSALQGKPCDRRA
mmetsp:Transcript_53098/g.114069  ORF Transcript_53098/g.114069 Transcript_53098/m.114069 type:complete len:201 (+) Transcript_53098:801-1403(+)